MTSYKVTLQRTFDITVQTGNQTEASQIASFYLGYIDESTLQEREYKKFTIISIEMLENETIRVVETE